MKKEVCGSGASSLQHCTQPSSRLDEPCFDNDTHQTLGSTMLHDSTPRGSRYTE